MLLLVGRQCLVDPDPSNLLNLRCGILPGVPTAHANSRGLKKVVHVLVAKAITGSGRQEEGGRRRRGNVRVKQGRCAGQDNIRASNDRMGLTPTVLHLSINTTIATIATTHVTHATHVTLASALARVTLPIAVAAARALPATAIKTSSTAIVATTHVVHTTIANVVT